MHLSGREVGVNAVVVADKLIAVGIQVRVLLVLDGCHLFFEPVLATKSEFARDQLQKIKYQEANGSVDNKRAREDVQESRCAI